MNTALIIELRQKFLQGLAILAQRPGDKHLLTLDAAQLEYLVNLLGSHITWRRWLVPDE